MSHDGLGMFENNIAYANITTFISLRRKGPALINVLYMYHHNIVKDNYNKYPSNMLYLLPAIFWILTLCVEVVKSFMYNVLP